MTRRSFMTVQLGAAAFCLLAISACTSVNLVQLDNEWARTYAAMQDAERDADYIASVSTYDSQLADLSRRAATAGDKTQDVPTAIGYYRIAALAAWKSGVAAENAVPRLTEKGRAACQRLPQHDASQPRDCSLFRMIDHFADYDQQARRIAGLRESGATLSASKLTEAVDALNAVTASIARIDEARQESMALPLPAEFFAYIRANLRTQYCTAHGLAGWIFASDADASMVERVRQTLLAAEARLKQARVITQCQAG